MVMGTGQRRNALTQGLTFRLQLLCLPSFLRRRHPALLITTSRLHITTRPTILLTTVTTVFRSPTFRVHLGQCSPRQAALGIIVLVPL